MREAKPAIGLARRRWAWYPALLFIMSGLAIAVLSFGASQIRTIREVEVILTDHEAVGK